MDLGIKLVDDYVKWYKENTIIRNINESVQLTTPFVNHINDRIQLYITPVGDGFEISDDGMTLNELEMSGIDLATNTRQKMVSTILAFYDVKLRGDELVIFSEQNNFPKKKHQLIQAVLKTYDLLLTKRDVVISLFNDEVLNFLYDNDFGGTPNIKMMGKSGIDYSVDYSIGSTKKRPETLIQFANNLTFNSITTFDFMFDDVRGMRNFELTQTKFVIIANDNENSVSKKARLVAKAHNILVYPWSSKEEILRIKEFSK